MKKIYAKANEKFVKAVVLYANDSNVLCYDSAKTDKVPADMVKNLFEKGLILVSTAAGEYKPTLFTDETTYYAVSAVYFTGSPAAATLLTFKSDTIA